MDKQAIKVDSLSKTFKLPHEKKASVKTVFINAFRSGKGYELQKALQDVSFDVKPGEFFGIVGRNGSGKSTLLKLLAGIYTPTNGSVSVNGSLTPFIELGVGFNQELTGRENVYLNGALLGFSRKEMQRMYKDIVAFAEIERFMDQKLKNYSSGMQVRLAFSIAIRAESDILLIDEVLAVGDANFQKKCFNYFKEIKKNGRTVVFVSHDMGAVKDFCDRAILISDGQLLAEGPAAEIATKYTELNLSAEEKTNHKGNPKHWGTGQVKLTDYTLNKDSLYRPSDKIEIILTAKAKANVTNPTIGVIIKDMFGKDLFATNTRASKNEVGDLAKGQSVTVRVVVDNVFNDGTYTVSPAIASHDEQVFYDWVDDALKFDVGGWEFPAAAIQAPHKIIVEKDINER